MKYTLEWPIPLIFLFSISYSFFYYLILCNSVQLSLEELMLSSSFFIVFSSHMALLIFLRCYLGRLVRISYLHLYTLVFIDRWEHCCPLQSLCVFSEGSTAHCIGYESYWGWFPELYPQVPSHCQLLYHRLVSGELKVFLKWVVSIFDSHGTFLTLTPLYESTLLWLNILWMMLVLQRMIK
jgi:hypothetical protein